MRPQGTKDQLAARRAQALKLLSEGHGPSEVARRVGVVRQTIYDWKAKARQKRKRAAKRPPGRICQLSARQQKQLAGELLKGAYAHGYPDDHWTLDRIGRVIFDLYGVRYHPSSVWHLMHRMGWSNQRSQRVAIQRDDPTVEQWRKKKWPRIKKVA